MATCRRIGISNSAGNRFARAGGPAYGGGVTRHHLVPQFWLRNFADSRERLMMIPRRPPHQRRGVSVAKACAEQGFYEIATSDLEESHRAGHDPEAVEKVLASLEGTVSRIMADFPPRLGWAGDEH